MAIRFVPLNGKIRTSKNSYMVDDIPVGMTKGNLGVLMPKDCVVVDIDSASPASAFYVEWLRAKFPKIFITKTVKTGGYHVWFKTGQRIRRDTGLMSVFGWRFDILTGTTNYITLPDNYDGRSYVSGFKSYQDLAFGWDTYDVFLPESIDDIMPYVDASPDHLSPIQFSEGGRNSGLIEWLGYFVAKGVSVERIKKHSRVLCSITGLSEHELSTTILSSLAKYENRDTVVKEANGIPSIDKIVGDDYVSISLQLRDFIKENDLFGFDEATGLGYCNIAGASGQGLTQKELRDKMVLYFGDKLYYTVRDKDGHVKKLAKLPTGDRDVIFEEAKQYVKFNSREQQYKDIPEWDGTERIGTFMKDYYECDVNPNFFWLLMTSIVGKLKEPEKCYVPFWFDLVGQRGVGKTSLIKKLSCNRCTKLAKGRSVDDMFVNVYTYNSLVAYDDECSVTKMMDYDLWKAIVTDEYDVFSRKFQQPEKHPRSFVLMRTSNKVKTGYDTEERRQVIFESKLAKNECRIMDLPDEFFEQMFAEAKVYYEKYGVYKLTNADWECVEQQQVDSFDTENTYYVDVFNYVSWVRNKIKAGVLDKPECWIKSTEIPSGYGITWQTYRAWCENTLSKPMNNFLFWNQVSAVAMKTRMVEQPSVSPIFIRGGATKYAEINTKEVNFEKRRSPAEIQTTSVLGFFEPAKKKNVIINDGGLNSRIASELGANKFMKHPSIGQYKIPDLLRWCPEQVREFFTVSQGSNVVSPTAIEAYGLDITYGLGGIHFAVRDYTGEDLMYVDVRSMYPNIMINFDLFSRSITKKDVYIDWVRQREKAKGEGDKLKDAELKLKINSVYGLMKADWCTLYDPYMASSIAVMGQVLMTILIGGLVSTGCEIINANTDGLIIKPNGRWHNICEQWEKNTGLTLTYKPIKHLVQANVNNYRAIMPDGEVINKGEKFASGA